MTVRELIAKLKEFDENLEVELTSGSGWNCYGKEIDNIYIDEVYSYHKGKLIIE